ncbi:hypothetical protein N0V93_001759 [Gnomoniopsis smithogilvyi]|uniref:Thioredoxin-like protein AAED1 n=1 Tax=Gnomoniopsis smithogilvyi TaxID=1191159 RepID=A0A9W8Z4E6_9PEZI|nr:hypothetical protein N0V93_001759 [Gnomoniopsis smithogilvyi]
MSDQLDKTAQGEEGSHRQLPDDKALAEAGDVMIKDKEGNSLPFKSLWTGKPENERQLIVFVRHFFCGSCKQYLQALNESLPSSSLSEANITLAIIGCGQPVGIPLYAKETNSSCALYTDPSLRTHELLGMKSNMRTSKVKPDYIKQSLLENIVNSAQVALTSGHAFSGGPPGQNGGEWLFQGGQLKWCHRMRNSTDHTEVKELKAVLGM